jgi:hypothetical protein
MDFDLVEDAALQVRLRDLMNLMSPMRAIGFEKKRYGRIWDGGYVVLDSIKNAEIVYSLGICDDVSFDEVLADFGAQIYQYDHTVDRPPVDHVNFHFFKIGLANTDDWLPYMRRLDTLVRSNGHESTRDMVLKIDIEGHEWDQYDLIDTEVLGNFDQIVGEFHSFGNVRSSAWLERAERSLRKLNHSHQVVHVHGNNNGTIEIIAGMPIPDVIELTWARRSSYTFAPTNEIFPGELDQPCTPAKPDLCLGSFHF